MWKNPSVKCFHRGLCITLLFLAIFPSSPVLLCCAGNEPWTGYAQTSVGLDGLCACCPTVQWCHHIFPQHGSRLLFLPVSCFCFLFTLIVGIFCACARMHRNTLRTYLIILNDLESLRNMIVFIPKSYYFLLMPLLCFLVLHLLVISL